MFHRNYDGAESGRSKSYRSFARQFSLLLILPLIFGIAVLVCVQAVVSRQINQVGTIATERFEAQTTGILRELQMVSDSFLNDRRFMTDIEMPAEEIDAAKLCSQLSDHARESLYVSQIYVLSPLHERIYTEKTYYTYRQDASLLSDIIPTSYDIDLTETEGWHILNQNYTPPHYVSLCLSQDGDALASILVMLDMRALLHSIYRDNDVFCCMFNDEFSLSTIVTNHPGINWRSADAVSELVGTRVRCFYMEQDGFTYLTAIPTRSFYAPLWTVMGVFVIYFALLLIVGMIYLRSVSLRRYKEMVSLIDGLPQSQNSDPTYDEIMNTIRASLSDYRDRSRAERQHQALSRLLSGGFAGAIPAQQLQEAGLSESSSGYYAVLFNVSGGRGIIEDTSPAMNEDMTCLILRSALSQFSGGSFEPAVTHIDRNYCAVLSLNDRTVPADSVRTAVLDTVSLIELEYGFDLSAMISSRVSAPEELKTAYQESRSLFGFHQAVDSDANVLMQEEVLAGTGVLPSGEYMKQLQVLSNTLLLEKYEFVPAMVATILEDHVAKSRQHYSHAQERIYTIAGLLSDAVLSSGLSDDTVSTAAERLRSANSISSLNLATEEAFAYLSRKALDAGSEDPVIRAEAYIAEKLADPNLSIPIVCEAVGVSVQHLSRLFRKKLNTTISEYINAHRVEKAKPLLMEKSRTVASIAERCGYANAVTFSRNFRRITGMTPSEYRELNG